MERIDIIDLKTGDTLFVKSKGLLPMLIRKFQKCEYNHTGTVVLLDENIFISEADAPGIVFTNIDHYLKQKRYSKLLIIRPRHSLNHKQKAIIIEQTAINAGRKGYDFFNLLVAQAIRYATNGRIWIGANNKESGERKFICGEWCCYLYSLIIPDFPLKEWYKCGPADLYDCSGFDHYQLKGE